MMAWAAMMAVLGMACWSAVLSTACVVTLQKCKYEVKSIRKRVALNAAVKRDVEVLEGWWFRAWWWMSWVSAWVDELLMGGGGGHRGGGE